MMDRYRQRLMWIVSDPAALIAAEARCRWTYLLGHRSARHRGRDTHGPRSLDFAVGGREPVPLSRVVSKASC